MTYPENQDLSALGLQPTAESVESPQVAAPLTRREARELEGRRAPAPVATAAPVAPVAEVSHHNVSTHTNRFARGAIKRGKAQPRPARGPRTKRHTGSKLLSLGAMTFAGALLVGMSVPANAFMTDTTSLADTAVAEKVSTQTMAVADDVTFAAPARDTFGVTSYAEMLRSRYGSVSFGFSATTGSVRWPFPYGVPITDGFGDRPSGVSGTSHHNGVDFTPGNGTPIYAIADGVVTTHAEDAGGYGNHVIISHVINGQAIDSVYAHMQYGTSALNAGDAIKVGDFIGLVGDTGNSYGAHLHFEIRIDKIPVDPFAWLQANAVN